MRKLLVKCLNEDYYTIEHLGDLLKLIQSFLTDRKYCVKVDNSQLSERLALSKDLQGSVLGSLLPVNVNDPSLNFKMTLTSS